MSKQDKCDSTKFYNPIWIFLEQDLTQFSRFTKNIIVRFEFKMSLTAGSTQCLVLKSGYGLWFYIYSGDKWNGHTLCKAGHHKLGVAASSSAGPSLDIQRNLLRKLFKWKWVKSFDITPTPPHPTLLLWLNIVSNVWGKSTLQSEVSISMIEYEYEYGYCCNV